MEQKSYKKKFIDLFDESFDIPEYKCIPRKIGYRKYLYGYKNIYSICFYESRQRLYTGGPIETVGFTVECKTVRGSMPVTIYTGTDEKKAMKTFRKEIEGFEEYLMTLSEQDKLDIEKERSLVDEGLFEVDLTLMSI